MAHAGACVSKVATSRFWVTTSPRSATSLPGQDTSEGDAGHLAARSHCRMELLYR